MAARVRSRPLCRRDGHGQQWHSIPHNFSLNAAAPPAKISNDGKERQRRKNRLNWKMPLRFGNGAKLEGVDPFLDTGDASMLLKIPVKH